MSQIPTVTCGPGQVFAGGRGCVQSPASILAMLQGMPKPGGSSPVPSSPQGIVLLVLCCIILICGFMFRSNELKYTSNIHILVTAGYVPMDLKSLKFLYTYPNFMRCSVVKLEAESQILI